MEEKIKFCNELINGEINESIEKFNYFEDKINFNQESIFYLLNRKKEIYEGCGNRREEIKEKINEICIEKSKEYDDLVLKKKPKWNKINRRKNFKNFGNFQKI